MESHPDFHKIINEVINDRMTRREAARLLGSTEPNFSQYMKRHYPKHKPKPKKKKRKSSNTKAVVSSQGEEAALIVELSNKQNNEEWGTIGWKVMVQNLLTTLTTEDIDIHETIKLTRALTDLLKFQFSHNVPDVPREIIKIDEEQARKIIDEVMANHDEWCPYRNEFIKRKNTLQSKARFQSAEPSLVE